MFAGKLQAAGWRAFGGMSLGKRIESHGGTLANLVKILGPVAERLFAEHDLAIGFDNGRPALAEWYPLDKVLAVLDRVGEMLGDDALFRAGQAVPRTASWPGGLDGIAKALGSLDVAYHMNHRKDGVVMFDAKTNRLTDGIGHYVCTEEPRCIVIDSASRYPCAFDLGLITTMARRFQPGAEIDHLDSARCRRRGRGSCSYVITW